MIWFDLINYDKRDIIYNIQQQQQSIYVNHNDYSITITTTYYNCI